MILRARGYNNCCRKMYDISVFKIITSVGRLRLIAIRMVCDIHRTFGVIFYHDGRCHFLDFQNYEPLITVHTSHRNYDLLTEYSSLIKSTTSDESSFSWALDDPSTYSDNILYNSMCCDVTTNIILIAFSFTFELICEILG